MAGRSAELKLSIEIDSDPITGLVSGGTGEPQIFCGWMELVAAIEAVRLGAERAPGAASDTELGGSRRGTRERRQAPGAILG
ncbi:MAG TPA: hypothetical protein VGH24_13175 [Solirubrobacteraceae bacterium]|jgi:hypothetical protein